MSWFGNLIQNSAGAIVGGLSSLVGGALSNSANAKAQEKANETNIQIANQTNATNRAIANETNASNAKLASQQNQWNIDQWNRENAYNDPSAQVQRLENAGVNGLANIQNNSASSLQSANLANQQTGAPMQSATVNPAHYQDIISPAIQNALTASQVNKTQAETESIKQETSWIDRKNGAVVTLQEAMANSSKLANTFAERTMEYRVDASRFDKEIKDFQRVTAKEEMKQAEQKTAQMQYETQTMVQRLDKAFRALDDAHDLAEINKVLGSFHIEWDPQLYQAQLNKTNAETSKAYSDISVNNSIISKNDAETDLIKENTYGTSLDNTSKEVTLKSVIDKVKAESKQAIIELTAQGYTPLSSWLSTGNNLDVIRTISEHPEDKSWQKNPQLVAKWNQYCEMCYKRDERYNDQWFQQSTTGKVLGRIGDGALKVVENTSIGAGGMLLRKGIK